ncbi:MAG: TMEM165/GDT1 family protein [Aedoeadaptatus pacaensis]
MREFLEAFVMVFMGEMGDKSQFLALALATTYAAVLAGAIIYTLVQNKKARKEGE